MSWLQADKLHYYAYQILVSIVITCTNVTPKLPVGNNGQNSNTKLNEECFRPRFYTVKLYTGLGTTWANEVNFAMNHAHGEGSSALNVERQTSALQELTVQ